MKATIATLLITVLACQQRRASCSVMTTVADDDDRGGHHGIATVPDSSFSSRSDSNEYDDDWAAKEAVSRAIKSGKSSKQGGSSASASFDSSMTHKSKLTYTKGSKSSKKSSKQKRSPTSPDDTMESGEENRGEEGGARGEDIAERPKSKIGQTDGGLVVLPPLDEEDASSASSGSCPGCTDANGEDPANDEADLFRTSTASTSQLQQQQRQQRRNRGFVFLILSILIWAVLYKAAVLFLRQREKRNEHVNIRHQHNYLWERHYPTSLYPIAEAVLVNDAELRQNAHSAMNRSGPFRGEEDHNGAATKRDFAIHAATYG